MAFSPTALAQTPVALVEDITAKAAGVEMMDYVSAGKVIRLAAGESLELSYLKSCVRERIVGGVVTIDAEQSEVTGGQIDRQTVKCDGGKLQLTANQSSKSGAMVFRRAPSRPNATPAPDVTLFGASPVVVATGGGPIKIERLDRPGDNVSVTAAGPRGAYDFAAEGKSLAPGGLYRASAGDRQIVFQIDPQAAPGKGPLVGRLVQLPGA